MSKSILHKLITFSQLKKENDKHIENNEKTKVDLSYKWNTAYYLKRFGDSFKKNPEIQEFVAGGIDGLQTRLFLNNRSYDLVALAARWAELEIREIDSKLIN